MACATHQHATVWPIIKSLDPSKASLALYCLHACTELQAAAAGEAVGDDEGHLQPGPAPDEDADLAALDAEKFDRQQKGGDLTARKGSDATIDVLRVGRGSCVFLWRECLRSSAFQLAVEGRNIRGFS